MSKVNPTTNNNIAQHAFEKNLLRTNKSKAARIKSNSLKKQEEIENKTSGNAKVDISLATKDFAKIKKAVDLTPPKDNSQKIMDLKAQIKNGTYKINEDAITDKILSTEF
ncbi:MAG: flagellar biosynthesis anti-sigma factor FlgM [Bdellovibrionales bacterium]|jgi:flagellar biosynthesis anti-sigma factor FlgM|nr:flagellar biosynthesis anti-sigma factor FlgM [Bdellovibrionales bacterium]